MRRCSGNNTEEWAFSAIFEIECSNCGYIVEFFKDEIRRTCPKFIRSKHRWHKW
jgi:hypothetical protein